MLRSRSVLYGCGVLIAIGALVVAQRFEERPESQVNIPAPAAGVEPWVCPAGTVGRVTCAYIEVPEDHDDPDIARVRLFVARIEAPLGSSAPPVAYVGDGFGSAAVGELGEWQRVSRALGRDIVLVDPRGGGRSEPRLSCGDLQQVPWLASDLSAGSLDEARSQLAAVVDLCSDRLGRTLPLPAYSLDAFAADLDLVRQRLGIDNWTVVAGGDTAMVARRLEQRAPSTIESLVLIGAAPTSTDRHAARYEYAREVLRDALGAELLTEVAEAVAELPDRTVVFAVTVSGRTQRVAVGPEVVLPILARAVGDPAVLATLPALITDRLGDGRWRALAALRAKQYPIGRDWSLPVALGVLCGDPSVSQASEFWDDIVRTDPAWTGLLDDPTVDLALCASWPATRHAGVDLPPSSPVLVINGEYDVAAPASAADEIADHWPAATVVTVRSGGHPRPFDECVTEGMSAFLGPAPRSIDPICE